MPWLKKKPDPLTNRAKELSREIAQLEAEIQKLNSRKQTARPAVQSTVRPAASSSIPARPATPANDPVFEKVDFQRVAKSADPENTSAHYNDLGVRKYDLTALWRRIRNHFYGPPSSSPKLINYLAAGSIHGLRPLRYESRVARNRFIAATVFLALLLWSVIALYVKHQ